MKYPDLGKRMRTNGAPSDLFVGSSLQVYSPGLHDVRKLLGGQNWGPAREAAHCHDGFAGGNDDRCRTRKVIAARFKSPLDVRRSPRSADPNIIMGSPEERVLAAKSPGGVFMQLQDPAL